MRYRLPTRRFDAEWKASASQVNFRGNVQTRLRKLEEGIVDATLLAKAGLNRMSTADSQTGDHTSLEALCRGALAIHVPMDGGA